MFGLRVIVRSSRWGLYRPREMWRAIVPGLLNVWVPRDEMFLAMGDVLLHDGVLLLKCYVIISALRHVLRYVKYVPEYLIAAR